MLHTSDYTKAWNEKSFLSLVYITLLLFICTGGSFGLWVGWSIISMVEFIELAADLLVYLVYSRCGAVGKKNVKQTAASA